MTTEPMSYLHQNLFCSFKDYLATSPKQELEIGEHRYETPGICCRICSSHFIFSFAVVSKTNRKNQIPLILLQFQPQNFKFQSHHATTLFPHLYTLHPSFGDQRCRKDHAERLAPRSDGLHTQPNLEDAQWQVLLSELSSRNDPSPSIAWEPYQPPSAAPPITALLTIARPDNGNLLLRLISYPHSNGGDPHATVSISGLLAITRTSGPIPPLMFRVSDIKINKTGFSKPISHLFFRLTLYRDCEETSPADVLRQHHLRRNV